MQKLNSEHVIDTHLFGRMKTNCCLLHSVEQRLVNLCNLLSWKLITGSWRRDWVRSAVVPPPPQARLDASRAERTTRCSSWPSPSPCFWFSTPYSIPTRRPPLHVLVRVYRRELKLKATLPLLRGASGSDRNSDSNSNKTSDKTSISKSRRARRLSSRRGSWARSWRRHRLRAARLRRSCPTQSRERATASTCAQARAPTRRRSTATTCGRRSSRARLTARCGCGKSRTSRWSRGPARSPVRSARWTCGRHLWLRLRRPTGPTSIMEMQKRCSSCRCRWLTLTLPERTQASGSLDRQSRQLFAPKCSRSHCTRLASLPLRTSSMPNTQCLL